MGAVAFGFLMLSAGSPTARAEAGRAVGPYDELPIGARCTAVVPYDCGPAQPSEGILCAIGTRCSFRNVEGYVRANLNGGTDLHECVPNEIVVEHPVAVGEPARRVARVERPGCAVAHARAEASGAAPECLAAFVAFAALIRRRRARASRPRACA